MKRSKRNHRKRKWCKSAEICLETKNREIGAGFSRIWNYWGFRVSWRVIDLQVWIELNLGWLQPNQAKYIFNWNSSKQFLLLTFNLPLHRSVRSFRQRIYFCARIVLKAAKSPIWLIFLTKESTFEVSKQVTSLIFCKTFWPTIFKSW